MKFRHNLAAAYALGSLLAHHLKRQITDIPQVLVPIPLHKQRLQERGYNQAVELARPIAQAFGLRLETGIVRRMRATEPQATLAQSKARQANVAGAFRYVGHRRDGSAHAAIIDDVMTTGATVEEVARTLLAGGFRRVDAWVCARAVE